MNGGRGLIQPRRVAMNAQKEPLHQLAPRSQEEVRPTPDTPISGSQGRITTSTKSGLGTQHDNSEKPRGTVTLGIPSELHKARHGEVTADNPIST